ncbi:MAG: hypothetical protein JSV44_05280 [Candidatus Zixiibacteriota bacterium]|nr:MAG: hypothetical protein JSV44_05280 [candidate division Zixibacteria bacterium]
MSTDRDRIDRAGLCRKETLVCQRQSMWRDDTLSQVTSWMKMRPGVPVVNVGSRLGYLEYSFWRHFCKGGRHIGADSSPRLLREATGEATRWAVGGKAILRAGGAHRLPGERLHAAHRKQFEEEKSFACGCNLFYIVRAYKPD